MSSNDKWNSKRLGHPIATRMLVSSKHANEIIVRIWAPIKISGPDADGAEIWDCPFQIAGFGDEQVQTSKGADSVQALELSFAGIRAMLQPQSTGIRWMGEDLADAGFPRTINYSLGADFYYYLCAMMDREALPEPDDLEKSKRIRLSRVKAWKAQGK